MKTFTYLPPVCFIKTLAVLGMILLISDSESGLPMKLPDAPSRTPHGEVRLEDKDGEFSRCRDFRDRFFKDMPSTIIKSDETFSSRWGYVIRTTFHVVGKEADGRDHMLICWQKSGSLTVNFNLDMGN